MKKMRVCNSKLERKKSVFKFEKYKDIKKIKFSKLKSNHNI